MTLRVLGVDPGSRNTGFGIIDVSGNRNQFIHTGVLQLHKLPFAERLKTLYTELQTVIDEYQPQQLAIERVFMHKNAESALKLGHARGTIICLAAMLELGIYEYSAREIKQAVTGYGNADKQQIQHMIRILLNLRQAPAEDAADALAVALCHAHTNASLQRLTQEKVT